MLLQAYLRTVVHTQKRFLRGLSSSLKGYTLATQRKIEQNNSESDCMLCKLNIETDYNSIKLLSQNESTNSVKIYNQHLEGLVTAMQDKNNENELKRIEIVGSSFLEYAIAINLYCSKENVKAGVLTDIRMSQVSSKNLSLLAKKKFLNRRVTKADDTALASSDESKDLFLNKNSVQCVRTMIGLYLIDCGTRSALLFIAWLGVPVLPVLRVGTDGFGKDSLSGETHFGQWEAPPKSTLHCYSPNVEKTLNFLLDGFENFEKILDYKFRDRSKMLESVTHNSYIANQVTESYQRLEFIGDAILNYLIARRLFEDQSNLSADTLYELKSILTSNYVLLSLSIRNGFHQYLRHFWPGLKQLVDAFMKVQNSNRYRMSNEYFLVSDQTADIEEPKILADVFESVAGAIYVDSDMSLESVWKVYGKFFEPVITEFSFSLEKDPVKKLVELKKEAVKFGQPQNFTGKNFLIEVEVGNAGKFHGIGQSYRVAKLRAAQRALRSIDDSTRKSRRHEGDQYT